VHAVLRFPRRRAHPTRPPHPRPALAL
jgi:hypothetical protein